MFLHKNYKIKVFIRHERASMKFYKKSLIAYIIRLYTVQVVHFLSLILLRQNAELVNFILLFLNKSNNMEKNF